MFMILQDLPPVPVPSMGPPSCTPLCRAAAARVAAVATLTAGTGAGGTAGGTAGFEGPEGPEGPEGRTVGSFGAAGATGAAQIIGFVRWGTPFHWFIWVITILQREKKILVSVFPVFRHTQMLRDRSTLSLGP